MGGGGRRGGVLVRAWDRRRKREGGRDPHKTKSTSPRSPRRFLSFSFYQSLSSHDVPPPSPFPLPFPPIAYFVLLHTPSPPPPHTFSPDSGPDGEDDCQFYFSFTSFLFFSAHMQKGPQNAPLVSFSSDSSHVCPLVCALPHTNCTLGTSSPVLSFAFSFFPPSFSSIYSGSSTSLYFGTLSPPTPPLTFTTMLRSKKKGNSCQDNEEDNTKLFFSTVRFQEEKKGMLPSALPKWQGHTHTNSHK